MKLMFITRKSSLLNLAPLSYYRLPNSRSQKIMKLKKDFQNLKNLEVERNNLNLYNKITNIGAKTDLSKFIPKTIHIFKPKGTNKKMEESKIAKENKLLFKRLRDSSSYYNRNKWEKDFEKSTKYKLRICEFPSVSSKCSPNKDPFYEKFKNRPYTHITQIQPKSFNLTTTSFNKKQWNKTFNANFPKIYPFKKFDSLDSIAHNPLESIASPKKKKAYR